MNKREKATRVHECEGNREKSVQSVFDPFSYYSEEDS